MSLETMEVLNALMADYQQETIELKNDCINVDAEIAHWTEIRNALAKPHQDKLADIKTKMLQPMLDRAKTFVCSYGKISFRKGAVRRSWNLDALDQICNAKPEVKEQIWAFREENVGEPSISVVMNESK